MDPPEKRMAPSSVAAPVSAPGTTAAPSSSSNAVVKALPLPPPDTRWLAPQGLTWRPESHVILRGAPTPRWWVLACLRQQQEGRGRSGGGKQPAAARQEGSSGSAGRIEWQWALQAAFTDSRRQPACSASSASAMRRPAAEEPASCCAGCHCCCCAGCHAMRHARSQAFGGVQTRQRPS